MLGLAQAEIDDLHAGVTEDAGDDLDAAIVAVEAELRQHHDEWSAARCRWIRWASDDRLFHIGAEHVAHGVADLFLGGVGLHAPMIGGMRLTVGSAAAVRMAASDASTAAESRSCFTASSRFRWSSSTEWSMRSRLVSSSSLPSVNSLTPTMIRWSLLISRRNGRRRRRSRRRSSVVDPGVDPLEDRAVAEFVEVGEHGLGLPFHLVGHPLDVGGAAERVGHIGHTCFVSDDLLGAERDACAFSVGRARASSKESVCSDWVPPRAADNAWMATRAMLFSGC